MRLLRKTTFYYVFVSLLFFLIAGYLISLNINRAIESDIDKFLINREEIATTQIINKIPFESLNNFEQKIKFSTNNSFIDQLKLNDTTMYDIIEDEYHVYRQLKVKRKIGNKYYNITIYKSLIQSNLFVVEILKAMSIVFAGLLIFLIIIHLFISRYLWIPFNYTLSKLKQFELGSSDKIEFSKTNTKEFIQLNKMLNIMISKIHDDYNNLKEYTENVAHEIQTPLTIIKSKLDLILQSKNINEFDLKIIKTIYDTTSRLSKLNHGLTLLAKIESGAFENKMNINIIEVVESQLKHYEEIISLNNFELKIDLKDQIYYKINRDLIDILISNLIRNSIKHNIPNGTITITSIKNNIRISNTGKEIKINSAEFNRFHRFSKNSLGLGLSIVKKICKLYNIKINYSYENEVHNFDLTF